MRHEGTVLLDHCLTHRMYYQVRRHPGVTAAALLRAYSGAQHIPSVTNTTKYRSADGKQRLSVTSTELQN